MDNFRRDLKIYLENSQSDAIALGVLDFKNHTFETFEERKKYLSQTDDIYYDLASITKALTNGFVHTSQKFEDKKLELLVNHKAGLPSWGLLSRRTWKEQLLSYKITESQTLYSDFSANRYMLEVEDKLGLAYKDLVFQNLSQGIYHYLDLPKDAFCLQNGFYHQKPNKGKVHDPNAYNIKAFMSHAGLFATIKALCKSLIEFDKAHHLLKTMGIKHSDRFLNGFDTVEDPNISLAGKGCSTETFGHLGFTGTCFWIDPRKQLGYALLTNATKYYWYQKGELNKLRRLIGKSIWTT